MPETPKPIADNTFEVTLSGGDKIEIGDKESADFKPHIKLNRWDGECFIKVSLPTTEKPVPVIEGGKVKFGGADIEAHFYPLEPTTVIAKDKEGNDVESTQNELGGFEFEVILKKKPPTNKIVLDIETQGLKFYYQPALTQEDIDDGCIRPDNVIGSYAVYHATRTPFHKNKEDADKYKVGKAFHIYRPKITDADGNWVWGELFVDEGTLTIMIPQDFLDSAIYPLSIDPNFGYESVGSSGYPCSRDYRVENIEEPSGGSGTGTSISIAFLSIIGASKPFHGLLYDSGNNFVANGQTDGGLASVTGSFITLDFSGTPPDISDALYRIGCQGDWDGSDYVNVAWDTQAGETFYRHNTSGASYPNYPDPLRDDFAYPNIALSIYCTYTAVGGVDYPISLSPGLNASATVAYAMAWDRGMSPGLTVSATIVAVWGRLITTIANLTVNTTVDREVAYKRATSPGLTVAITVVRFWGRIITTTANLTANSVVARFMTYDRATTSNLTVAVTVLKGWGRAITTTANLTVSATVAIVKGFVRAITSNLTVSVALTAVTFRSVGVSPGAVSTTCIIVKPAGLAVDDLMIAHVVNDANYTWSPPDGSWTEIRQDVRSTYITSGLFWKIAVQADVDASDFTFTITSGRYMKGAISAWTGHDPTTPINANNGQGNTSSTTVTSPGITPSVANCEILFFVGGSRNRTCSGYAIATDNPASWNERYDISYSTAIMLAVADATRPETSATGDGTATLSGNTENTGQLVAIAPLAGGITRTLAYKRAVTANLTTAVTILKGWGRKITTSPGLTISATIVKGWGRVIAISTNLTISTTISRMVAFKRTVSSGLTISTTIIATLSAITHYFITVVTNLTVSTTVARAVAWTRRVPPIIRHEYYNTNDDQSFFFNGVSWQAQTFTPTFAHTITSVKLKLFRVGTPGTITVSIRATSGGQPTGADLISGTTDGDTLTTDSGGEWREITFGNGTYLNASIKYAIVVRVPSASGPDLLRWRLDDTAPTYSGGYHLRSSNSGSTWTDEITDDMMFEEWEVKTLGLTASVSIDRMVAYARTLSTGLTVAISILKSRGRTISISAGLTVSATVNRLIAYKRAITTALSEAVTIARKVAYARSALADLTVAVTIAYAYRAYRRLKDFTGRVLKAFTDRDLSTPASRDLSNVDYRNLSDDNDELRDLK